MCNIFQMLNSSVWSSRVLAVKGIFDLLSSTRANIAGGEIIRLLVSNMSLRTTNQSGPHLT